jgi:O-methyltransferase involved in polyketide biosynthesis
VPLIAGRVLGWLIIYDPPEQSAQQIAAAINLETDDLTAALTAAGLTGTNRPCSSGEAVWQFGLRPEETPALLRDHGWTEHEQVGPTEYAERYLAPLGRDTTVSQMNDSSTPTADGRSSGRP